MTKMQQSTKYDLQKLRKALKLSQKEAADSIGISVRSFQRMESNADLVDVTKFVLANSGKFVYPSHPFEFFKVGEKMFSLTEIKKW